MSLKSKLNRMKGHLQLSTSSDETRGQKEDQQPTKVEGNRDDGLHNGDYLSKKWESLGFKAYTYEEQISYEKRYIVPFDKTLKEELTEVDQLWKSYEKEHPLSSKQVPLDRMLFFDTETTGLSSGVGNSIFLIGYARIVEEGIEVTQHLLRDPSSEAAFLYRFLLDFKEDDFLVSYNGKAFDWPQVRTRHTFVRNQVPRLPEFGHIDLLHAARRLWKHELPSCRLSIVEREKLGIIREHDTPGSMAPILYFDYIHEQEPEYLRGIIDHNDQDVRSLVHLYINLSKHLFLRKETSTNEHVHIGHWFEQTKAIEMAKTHYHKAIEKAGEGREEAHFKLALLEKKRKNISLAKEHLLTCLSLSHIPKVEIFIELAKIMEHHDKDLEAAYDLCRKAKATLKESIRMTSSTRLLVDVENRLKRLEKKLVK